MNFIKCSFKYLNYQGELDKSIGYVVNKRANNNTLLSKWVWASDESTNRFIDNSNRRDSFFSYELVSSYSISEVHPQGIHSRYSGDTNAISTTFPNDINLDWSYIQSKSSQVREDLGVFLVVYKNVDTILRPIVRLTSYDKDFIKQELGLKRYQHIPLSFNVKEDSYLESYLLDMVNNLVKSDKPLMKGGISVEWDLNELNRKNK